MVQRLPVEVISLDSAATDVYRAATRGSAAGGGGGGGGGKEERKIPSSLPFSQDSSSSFPFLSSVGSPHPSPLSLARSRSRARALSRSTLGFLRRNRISQWDENHRSKIYEAEKDGSNLYTVELDLVFLFLSFSTLSPSPFLSQLLSLFFFISFSFFVPRPVKGKDERGKEG